jgi:N-acetyltransferase
MSANHLLRTVEVLRLRRTSLVPIHQVEAEVAAQLMYDARDVFRFYGKREEYPMPPHSLDDARRIIAYAQRANEGHSARYFATRDLTSGQWVGATSFLNVDLFQRRIEIGWTWLLPSAQRSHVNTEAKLLMLTTAFETLQCLRVEFRTDVRNEASRKAILRLGAREEGTFRSHSPAADGTRRDTVCFAITDQEWPETRERLMARIARTAV